MRRRYSPSEARRCATLLISSGNVVEEDFFSSALKCPLKHSSVQRRSRFKALHSAGAQRNPTSIQWPFSVKTSAVKSIQSSFFPVFPTQFGLKNKKKKQLWIKIAL